MKTNSRTNQDIFNEALINSISDSIIATELNGKILYWNKAAEELYKWKSEEVIGKNILEVTPSTTIQKQAEEIMNSLRNGDSWEGEFEVQDKNGRIFPVHVKDSPLLDSNGNLIGIIGISREISDIKEAENKLKKAKEDAEESKKKFETIFNMSQSLICIADINTSTFKFINPTFERILGYSKEELLSKPFTEFIHPDDIKRTSDVVKKQLKAGIAVLTFENRYLCKNGDYRWLNWNSYPIPEEDITYAIAHDITARKLEEKARRESEERFRIAQDMSPDGFTILKPVRNKQGRVVDFVWVYENNAVARMNGTDPQKVIGKRLLKLFPSHSNTQFLKTYIKVAESGKSRTFEESYAGETINKAKWFRIVVVPMDENIAILSQDISKRKNAEKELKESKEKLSLIVNESPFPVVIADIKDETIIYWSESAKALTGYSPKTVAEWYESAYPDERYRKQVIERWKTFLEKAKKSNEAINTGEYRIICKNGSIKDVVLYVQFIPGNLVVTINDITDRKKVEDTLKQQNQYLEKLNDSLESVVFTVDIEIRKIEYVNKRVKAVFGYNPDECIGRSTRFLYPNDEAFLDYGQQMQKAFQNNQEFLRIENTLRKKNGELFKTHITTSFLSQTRVVAVIRDITEQKETEQLLKNSEENLKSIVENSTNLFYKHDVNHKLNYLSPQIKDILGYEVEEAKILWTKFATDNPINEIGYSKTVAAIETGERQGVYDLEVMHKDGHKLWVEVRETPIVKNGKTVEIVGAIIDVTDKRKSEQELKLAKEKADETSRLLSTIINTTPDLIWLKDKKGIYLNCNKRFEDFFGKSQNEIVGKTDYDFVSKELADFFRHNDNLAMKAGKPSINEEKITFANDGHSEILETIKKPLLNKGNDIIGILGVGRDITNRKKEEKELILAKEKVEESEMQLKYSQKVARIGYYVFDVQSGKWTSSEMLDEIFGIDKNYVRDVNGWANIMHPDFKSEMLNYLSVNIIKNHENFNKSYQIINRKTNKPIWVHGLGSLELDDDNNVLKMFGTIQDISQTKEFEQEIIKAKEKAEVSDRLKSAFLANMSHEIRTPMNGIMGFTNLLQEPDLTGKQQQRYVEIIKKSGERMLNTVNDIIEISKIETGQITLSSTEINISKHLNTLYEFFGFEANKRGLKLILDNKLSENESLIITDKSKLSSILTNLIKNAIKFTKEGCIEIGCKKNNDLIEFYVKDSGIGIPADRKEAVFNRFEQADIEDKMVHEGSGLGLAIAKSYVEMLGGKIWVESVESKGSTFFFTISYNPVKVETKTKHENKKQVTTKVKELNILIVEDDETSSLYLSTILRNKAKNIQTVRDGLQAVEICKNNSNFDLILMDIKLPGIDGLEATKRIRKFNKGVKIIAQTAHALEGDAEKAIKAGCNGYISKPIKKEILFEKIQGCFR